MKDTMEGKFLPMSSVTSGMSQEVTPDIAAFTVQIVNVTFVGAPDQWVLVDAGMPESSNAIISAAEERFGSGARPKAIILTHGHFDHVGALVDLVRHWSVPVYAHEVEMPYLSGESDYPQPDASVEGGMVAKISPIFPNSGIDLGDHVDPFPEDGTVPHMPKWKWIRTPGHTPGHVSLFRDEDSALIAGDAFVTVKQDSLYQVVTQEPEVHGPPRYLTPDWQAAWESVKRLAALKPEVAVTGHGRPMSGDALTRGLEELAQNFDHIAIPDYGRFV